MIFVEFEAASGTDDFLFPSISMCFVDFGPTYALMIV